MEADTNSRSMQCVIPLHASGPQSIFLHADIILHLLSDLLS
jgi:hypothetical protein